MKKNEKGFILIELLIVAVFTATLFTLLYVNVIPLIGDYEQREKYDTLETKYALYDIRNEILRYDSDLWGNIKNSVGTNGFARLFEYDKNSTESTDNNKTGNDYIKPNTDLYSDSDNNYNHNLSTMFQAYHITSLYVTRYGIGTYSKSADEPENYISVKEQAKNNNLQNALNENDAEGRKYAKYTEEYIKQMNNFTLGYEYKAKYYRLIGCMYRVDKSDIICGSIEIMRS